MKKFPYHILYLFLALCFLLSVGCGKRVESTSQYVPPQKITDAKAIVKTARSQLGKPYRRGGTTPAGFDCSGFVQWTFSANGIKIPRQSRDQAKIGIGVKLSSLRPGDIVVFDPPGWGGLHTGIYIGNNSFIHSPRPKKYVSVASMQLPYWKKSFISGRRVVPTR